MTKTSAKFIRVLKGEALSPPPIWLMRQAGRYLPEYRAVREEAGGFLELCYDPDKATRVTLQPIERYDLDAAILFADILLVPQAVGMKLWFEKGEGPRLSPVLSENLTEIDNLSVDRMHDTLGPVYESVRRIRASLDDSKALIGFAGAPWTVATYMLAGKGVKDPSALRLSAYRDEGRMRALLDLLTEATSAYLIEQVRAGADAIQIFDSWAAGLPEPMFEDFCVEPVRRIAAAVKAVADVPVIAFPRGAGPAYTKLAALKEIDAVSIDTGLPPDWAAAHLSPHAVVQGGLDQLLLINGGQALFDEVDRYLSAFAGKPYIFNLGHGIVPETDPEVVGELIRHIRNR